MQPFRKSQGGVRNFLFTPIRSLRLTFNYHCIQSIENDVEGGIIPRQLINSRAFFPPLTEHFPRNKKTWYALKGKTLFFVVEGFWKLHCVDSVRNFIFNSTSSFLSYIYIQTLMWVCICVWCVTGNENWTYPHPYRAKSEIFWHTRQD